MSSTAIMRRRVTRALLLGLVTAGGFAIANFLFDVHLSPRQKVLEALGGAAVSLLSVFALWREQRRQVGEARYLTLGPSLSRGAFGGLLGGGLAGALVGAAYYIDFHHSVFQVLDCSTRRYSPLRFDPVNLTLVARIFVFGAIAGVVLGALTQLTAAAFYRLDLNKILKGVNESGAVLGGAAGGILLGGAAGIYFGREPSPGVPPSALIAAAVLGSTIVIASALLYEYDGRLRPLWPALALSLSALLLWFAIWKALTWRMNAYDVEALVEHLFPACGATREEFRGGAIVGGLSGGLVGFQVGLVLLIDRVTRGRRA